jgi:hypothetical protein
MTFSCVYTKYEVYFFKKNIPLSFSGEAKIFKEQY